MPHIAVEGSTTVARVANRLVPYDWPFARDEAARIDERWAELTRRNPALFDGRVLLSRSPSLEGDVLGGTSFETGYKPFLCWREFGYPGASVKNLFAMPALRGSDGAFLLGRMSACTANAGRLYFPAGTPEPADVGTDGLVDYENSILRELEEETGITPAEVTLHPRWTIVFAGPLVACMKVVDSALTAAELVERVAGFVSGQDKPELDGLVAVARPDDFDRRQMPPFMLHYLAEALRNG